MQGGTYNVSFRVAYMKYNNPNAPLRLLVFFKFPFPWGLTISHDIAIGIYEMNFF